MTPRTTPIDLAQCEAEFKLADVDKDGIAAGDDPEGDVWTTGFRVQMSYNQGNTTRQTIAEILAGNLSAVNELFQVETLGLPWPAYLRAQRAKQLPLMTGWLAGRYPRPAQLVPALHHRYLWRSPGSAR